MIILTFRKYNYSKVTYILGLDDDVIKLDAP